MKKPKPTSFENIDFLNLDSDISHIRFHKDTEHTQMYVRT